MIMRLARKCLRIYREHKRNKHYFTADTNPYGLSKSTVKKSHKLGFLTSEYVAFDLDNNLPNDYISEKERLEYREKINNIRNVFDNKLLCYTVLHNYVSMNKIYAYKLRNDRDCTMLESVSSVEDLLTILKNDGKLVYKRISMGGGAGFKLLQYDNNEFSINRTSCKQSDVLDLLMNTDDYLLEEFCVQSEFEMSLFPHSVNTIRMITIEHKDGTIELAYAIHRIGAVANKCVDNASAGGLFAEVNLNNGTLSAAKSYGDQLLGQVFSTHPVTDAQIEGVVIPDWHMIVEQMISLHRNMRFTGLKLIAWDVALTSQGIKIIEVNATSQMKFIQMFTPQRNNKIGLWMKEWGYLK